MKKSRDLENLGWALFIVECADKTFYTGMTHNLKKALIEINIFRKGIYFSKHPERLPVKIIFKEMNVPFKEAYAKLLYMRKMNRYLKKKLIKTKKWPMGGSWKKYLESQEI